MDLTVNLQANNTTREKASNLFSGVNGTKQPEANSNNQSQDKAYLRVVGTLYHLPSNIFCAK